MVLAAVLSAGSDVWVILADPVGLCLEAVAQAIPDLGAANLPVTCDRDGAEPLHLHHSASESTSNHDRGHMPKSCSEAEKSQPRHPAASHLLAVAAAATEAALPEGLRPHKEATGLQSDGSDALDSNSEVFLHHPEVVGREGLHLHRAGKDWQSDDSGESGSSLEASHHSEADHPAERPRLDV